MGFGANRRFSDLMRKREHVHRSQFFSDSGGSFVTVLKFIEVALIRISFLIGYKL